MNLTQKSFVQSVDMKLQAEMTIGRDIY